MVETNKKMVETNKKMAETNKKMVETNKKMAETNKKNELDYFCYLLFLFFRFILFGNWAYM